MKPSRFCFGAKSHSISEWEFSCDHITYAETAADSNIPWCDLVFVMKATRLHKSYTVNYILLPFFLTGCVFATSSIAPDDNHDRMSVTLTLLLTLTAMKLSLNDAVPKTPYLTVGDIYTLSNFVILLLVFTENWMVSFFLPRGSEQQIHVDNIALLVLFVLYILWNFFFFAVVWTHIRKRKHTPKDVMKGRKYMMATDLDKKLDSLETSMKDTKDIQAKYIRN